MPDSLCIYTLGLDNPHLEDAEDSGILKRTFLRTKHLGGAWLEEKLERKEYVSPLGKNWKFSRLNGNGIKARAERDLGSAQDNLSDFVKGAAAPVQRGTGLGEEAPSTCWALQGSCQSLLENTPRESQWDKNQVMDTWLKMRRGLCSCPGEFLQPAER